MHHSAADLLTERGFQRHSSRMGSTALPKAYHFSTGSNVSVTPANASKNAHGDELGVVALKKNNCNKKRKDKYNGSTKLISPFKKRAYHRFDLKTKCEIRTIGQRVGCNSSVFCDEEPLKEADRHFLSPTGK